MDPVEPGFLVTQVFVQFIGAFYCNTGRANATLLVSLNRFDLPEFDLPTKPTPGCFCPHCVATFASPYGATPAGWPTYNYGANNTVLVAVQNPQVQEICLSQISVMLGTYRVIPIPSGAIPRAAPITGGVRIVILGKYFRQDLDYRCRFGATYPDPPFATFLNDTALACTTPVLASSGLVHLKLEPDIGMAGSTPTNNYSVDLIFYSEPTLTGVTPAAAKPGENVTVVGAGFVQTGDITCLFSNVAVEALFINSTALLCTVPSIVDIEVTALNLAVSLNGVSYSPSTMPFTYMCPL